MRRLSTNASTPHPGFVNTRWSLVLHAGASDQPHARQALEELCRVYWPPLYAFVRRQGVPPHQAEDLTQEFFARLLAGPSLGLVDRQRGRFRSYLLGALKHFLANEWDRLRTQKRGGKIPHLHLDTAPLETRLGLDPGHHESPDRLYDRQWTLALLDRVLCRLEAEQSAAGHSAQFRVLKPALTFSGDAAPYAKLASELQLSEGAVKVAIHRLRKRYRQLLREEVGETVHDQADIDDEMRHLLAVL